MNITRLASLAAASFVTASQWSICFALFFYVQPVSAIGAQLTGDIARSDIPEIIVIGHRPQNRTEVLNTSKSPPRANL